MAEPYDVGEKEWDKQDEKQEKEWEKQEEKEAGQEKNWDEKWRRDPLSAAVWACILIWAGLALLLGNLEFWAAFRPLGSWDFVFIGAGVILLLEVLVRMLVPSYRQAVTGRVILAVFLVSIGLQDLPAWDMIWPFGLILIGLVILMRGVLGRRPDSQ